MLKYLIPVFLLVSIAKISFADNLFLNEHPTLAIGAAAPDFNLPATDGKNYTLASFKEAKILVVVFTCNHCPTAQAYEDRIIALTNTYKNKGVAVVAIMPNDPKSIRLDELGYTDLSDSFDEMKIRASEKHFNFPYLYDGDNQEVSKKYGPIATPHVFIFDAARKLRYSGRVDDVEKPGKTPHHTDAANAIDALLQNKPVTVTTTKVFGCSIKWAEKSNWITLAQQQWAAEPVTLHPISTDSIQYLLQNHSDKLRLINVWATWCGPCVTEFSQFITINRMYRGRDFEFISISADDPAKQMKALEFLKSQQASSRNYIFNSDDKYKLIEAIDPNWQGALPYTILVEPGGKIVYAKEGAIDPALMKKTIVDNPYIGRYY
ncbi:MAG: redoxin domain-containing protein [Sphingobacteriales bacterium]|uniref:redoxin family protein n=1 Tax=Hydrotalea flava TaxID=714549 RepID=UPI0008339FE7|nr:redoxin family protein [Hydrotalea flava]RTL49972.1 MAG: redoxin domain-containing protein [Sphingobacteriales bacterium]